MELLTNLNSDLSLPSLAKSKFESQDIGTRSFSSKEKWRSRKTMSVQSPSQVSNSFCCCEQMQAVFQFKLFAFSLL